MYDIVCVGFGPAGLSLAIALEENEYTKGLNKLFIEASEEFNWHNDFLLPGTTINHNPLRDLVTPRNPLSYFSFANYLKVKERIYDFGHRSDKVHRYEWYDYMNWCASFFSKNVIYGRRVTSISVFDKKYFEIKDNLGNVVKAKNVVLATGMTKKIPDIFKDLLDDRIFHTSNFLSKLKNVQKPESIMVLGSGQSAAESIIFLKQKFCSSKILSVHSDVGFKVKENGHFSNTVYYPSEVDYFYNLPDNKKEIAFQKSTTADYGNVNFYTSQQLFDMIYEDKVRNILKVEMINRSKVVFVEKKSNSLDIHLRDIYSNKEIVKSVDCLILATGYQVPDISSLLNFKDYNFSQFKIDRDYKLIFDNDSFEGGIYLCGLSEKTHGISDTQSFSLMSYKTETIVKNIIKKEKNINNYEYQD